MLQQRLNSHGQSFAIHYDSANLGAAIEVIVHFHVTPGVKLFYKPQGEAEQDISNKVSDSGDVTLPTSIRKGEDFIYARINSGKIDKYIRINVYTQKVGDDSGAGILKVRAVFVSGPLSPGTRGRGSKTKSCVSFASALRSLRLCGCI